MSHQFSLPMMNCKKTAFKFFPMIYFKSSHYLRYMKKNDRPQTKTKNPEPKKISDWIIWAAWADRITFEEIREKTGYTEGEVIKIMRKSLKPSSFKLWRKRVSSKSIKHRKKFEQINLMIKAFEHLLYET